MANAIVEIPDGLFCSDKGHLDCQFADHTEHIHWCRLYRYEMRESEMFMSEGYLRRARRKCKKMFRSYDSRLRKGA